MTKQDSTPPSLLARLANYDPETGKLTWLERSVDFLPGHRPDRIAAWNSRYAGTPAFNILDNRGYYSGHALGFRFLAHRVAWAIHHLEWPVGQIDHISGNKLDNRMENLRVCTQSENMRNAQKPKGKFTSEFTGVSFNSSRGKWRAQLSARGGAKWLGYFSSEREAAMAYDAAAIAAYGEYARPNFR